MLDTVRFKLEPSPFRAFAPDWNVQKGTREEPDGVRQWSAYQHKESDLRIFGTDGLATSMEVSLPKLLNGHNGKLLRPGEVNTSYFAALDLGASVLQECLPEKVNRLDLVHHFHGWAFEYVSALRGLKHTAVRKKQVEYFDSGLEWPGKNLHIRLYDKKAEMCNQPGLIQRLEAQLRGNKLERVVWSQRSGFDVNQLYSMYKEICGGFASRRLPKIGTLEELLYWLKDNDVRVQGTCPVERFLSYRSKRTRYRIQKALNDISLTFFDASFTAHLPDNINDLTFLDCLPDAGPLAPEAPLGVGARAA